MDKREMSNNLKRFNEQIKIWIEEWKKTEKILFDLEEIGRKIIEDDKGEIRMVEKKNGR